MAAHPPAIPAAPDTVQLPASAAARAGARKEGAATKSGGGAARDAQLASVRAIRVAPLWPALAGLVAGGALAYGVASLQYREQIAAAAQANELRVQAANQRIEQLQAQLRSAQQQSENQQLELQGQADAQELRILEQASAQEHDAAAKVARERALVAQAQQRADQAQQQADQAQQRARELAKPDLPLRVWVKKPLVGNGLVGQVHSFAQGPIAVRVSLRRASGVGDAQWSGTLAPNVNLAIGPDPGWRLANGDDLLFEADGYRPLDVPVRPHPKTPDTAAR